jgi:MFS transporter, MHS family, shikimate and dehydroshikimate transport protein
MIELTPYEKGPAMRPEGHIGNPPPEMRESSVEPRSTVTKMALAKTAFASFSGTTVEYYDFLAYAIAASTVFPVLFFPSEDPLVGTIMSFGTFAAGFLMRPLGGIVIGHFGDRLGRKAMLVFTLLIMGAATTLIGVLPTYEQAGIWAPIGLIALRLIQGFSAGGEFGGAALMIVEHAPSNRRGFYGSWPVLGISAGGLLATIAFAALGGLSSEQFLSWGWRVPFLASIVMVAIGLWVRFGIEETPDFVAAQKTDKKESLPLSIVLRKYPKEVLLSAGSLIGYTTFIYIVFTFVLSYGTTELGLGRQVFLNGVMLGSALQFVAIPFFGALSDRVGRKPVLIGGSAFLLIYPFILFSVVNTKNPILILLAVSLAYVGAAAAHAPMGAFFAELFGTGVRYSGVSLGYQLGSVLGGGLAPLIATSLFAGSQNVTSVAVYAMLASLVSLAAVLMIAIPKNTLIEKR